MDCKPIEIRTVGIFLGSDKDNLRFGQSADVEDDKVDEIIVIPRKNILNIKKL